MHTYNVVHTVIYTLCFTLPYVQSLNNLVLTATPTGGTQGHATGGIDHLFQSSGSVHGTTAVTEVTDGDIYIMTFVSALGTLMTLMYALQRQLRARITSLELKNSFTQCVRMNLVMYIH